MSDDSSNIELSKKGVIIRWHYIALILGTIAATNIAPHFLPNLYVERTRSEIEAQIEAQKVQMTAMQEQLKSCQEVNYFIMHQFGLDKMTSPATDTTRRR